jgi:hypothetical protein
MGYSPIDSVRSRNVGELVARIIRLSEQSGSGIDISREKLLAVHTPNVVLERILKTLHEEVSYDLPYSVACEFVDIRHFQEQWERAASINLNTRASDYLSLKQRFRIAYLMWQHNVFGLIKGRDALKMLVSNLPMRRFRNR